MGFFRNPIRNSSWDSIGNYFKDCCISLCLFISVCICSNNNAGISKNIIFFPGVFIGISPKILLQFLKKFLHEFLQVFFSEIVTWISSEICSGIAPFIQGFYQEFGKNLKISQRILLEVPPQVSPIVPFGGKNPFRNYITFFSENSLRAISRSLSKDLCR